MSKHTPGPWTVFKGTRNDVHLPQAQRSASFCGCLDEKGWPVAEVHTGNIHANARLIAAAPEMLEALIEFIECGSNAGHNADLVARVTAVIKKARGEK